MDYYQFLGTIILFSGDYAPSGWAFCDGQSLPIAGNEGLNSIINKRYGGDDTTFKLPDLRSRTAISAGEGPGLYFYPLGHSGGEETNQITGPQMPAHNHGLAGEVSVGVNEAAPSTEEANGSTLGNTPSGNIIYNEQPVGQSEKLAGVTHNLDTLPLGSGEPVNNMQPYLVMNYIIAIAGSIPEKPYRT